MHLQSNIFLSLILVLTLHNTCSRLFRTCIILPYKLSGILLIILHLGCIYFFNLTGKHSNIIRNNTWITFNWFFLNLHENPAAPFSGLRSPVWLRSSSFVKSENSLSPISQVTSPASYFLLCSRIVFKFFSNISYRRCSSSAVGYTLLWSA